MKYIILSLFFLFVSCRTVQPLQGNYIAKTHQITNTANFESVWDKIIDMYSQAGKSFKIISKNDGLIVLRNNESPLTYEKKGKLVDSTAWAVAERVYNVGNRSYYLPIQGIIEWSLHIKKGENNSSIIVINMISPIKVTKTSLNGEGEIERVYKANAYSNGVFEVQLEKMLK